MRNPTSSSPFALLAGAATLALALAACGGGDTGTSGGGGSGSPSAGGSVTVDQELADQVPSAISSDGTITVGTDATYAPNEFLDPDGQTVIGFDVDLFKAVAAKLGLDGGVHPGAVLGDHPGRLVGQVRDRGLVVHHQRRPGEAGQHDQLLQRRHPVGGRGGEPRRDRPRRGLRQEGRGPAGHRAGRRHHRPLGEVHVRRRAGRSRSTSTRARTRRPQPWCRARTRRCWPTRP